MLAEAVAVLTRLLGTPDGRVAESLMRAAGPCLNRQAGATRRKTPRNLGRNRPKPGFGGPARHIGRVSDSTLATSMHDASVLEIGIAPRRRHPLELFRRRCGGGSRERRSRRGCGECGGGLDGRG